MKIILFWIAVIYAVSLSFSQDPWMDPQEDYTEWVALDLTKDLLPVDSITQRVEKDLDLIKKAFPEVEDINNRTPWFPGIVVLDLTQEGWDNFQAGLFSELDSLNTFYGVDSISAFAPSRVLGIYFSKPYNASILADIYSNLPNIFGSNYITVKDGDYITFENGTYFFHKGWMDCEAGCVYHHYWEFVIENSIPKLVKSYGDELTHTSESPRNQFGAPVVNSNFELFEHMFLFTTGASSEASTKKYDIKGKTFNIR